MNMTLAVKSDPAWISIFSVHCVPLVVVMIAHPKLTLSADSGMYSPTFSVFVFIILIAFANQGYALNMQVTYR